MANHSHTVTRERAGDGSLWEVTDLRGKVVSAHPMARPAAVRLAEQLDADATQERRMLAVSERA